MARHLVGLGFAHCTTTRISITDSGRAWLSQFVDAVATRSVVEIPAPVDRAPLDLPLFLAARENA
jgi:hypothetical protein